MAKITMFESFAKIDHPVYVELSYALNRIKTCKIENLILPIRMEQDAEKRRILKTKLPCILFSGTFSQRNDEGCIEHSGYCIMDFDKLKNVSLLRDKLKSKPYVAAVFFSPSGDGLKALIRIPADKRTHKGHYNALLRLFPEADPTSRNLSRICYESIDPEIYINENAEEFIEYDEVEEQQPVKTTRPAYTTDYSKLDIAAKMIRNAPDGEKHYTLLKASKLVGGWVGAGLVEDFIGYSVLEHEISKKNVSDMEQAKKTITDGLHHGRMFPLYGEETEKAVESIVRADDVWDRMKFTFLHGKSRGSTTHFPVFDQNFTWKAGDVSLIIARPNSGKTEFALQLMLMKSVFDGWKWGIFSPENYPADEFFDSLIHSYIGKSVDPYYRDFQMSLEEYENGKRFVNNHFFYVYPQDKQNIESIEIAFRKLIQEEKISGSFIDPFNQIEEDHGKRDDQFLSSFLKSRKKFATQYNLCDVISAHPKAMNKNKEGGYDVPDIYDIAMGAMWANKMDNIISLHRPHYHTDPKNTAVEVHVKKIKKQKLVGIPGISYFDFSRGKNRYYQDGKNPLEI